MSRLSAAAIAAAIFIAPIPAWAQTETFSRVSFSAWQMYDANLFATPMSGAPQADLITRFGPTLEAGYLSVPLELDARYEMQAERYVNHPDLDENLARHDGTIGLRYLPNERFRVSLNAQFVRTQNPAELNIQSQLSVGRAPAERLAFTSTASYNWTEGTMISAGHTFGRDDMSGGLTSATNSLQMGLRRRTSDRSSYRIDYELRQVDFGQESPIVSHVITAGRSYSITPRTGFDIAAGPRVTGGSIRPEITAALSRQVSWGELSLAYLATELTAIGEEGLIRVQRVAGTGRYRATRRLTLSATPAFTHNAQGDRRAPVYSLDVDSALEVNRRLSLGAWGRIARQDGTLSGSRERIAAQSVGVKLLLTLPRSAGGDATGRSPS
jgi:hypothetical protein